MRIMIKESTFEGDGKLAEILEMKGFDKKDDYELVGYSNGKVLIANDNVVEGEMVELFPRNCLYIGD
jgi:hypothetical protein